MQEFEADLNHLKINPEDVRITMCTDTRNGGWFMEDPVGIALFHTPTNTYVECKKYRSQFKNKAEALQELERLLCLAEISKLDQEGGLYG